jgi:hypothetical protein
LFTISEETGLSDRGIVGAFVGAFGFIALCIAALRCFYKKRQDRNESTVSINLVFIKIKVSNVLA